MLKNAKPIAKAKQIDISVGSLSCVIPKRSCKNSLGLGQTTPFLGTQTNLRERKIAL